MALKDRVDELNKYIEDNKSYLDLNADLFQIKEGDLARYIEDDLEESLSPNYFSKIKNRIVPINVLRRVLDKLSKVYSHDPVRTVVEPNATDEELLAWYEDKLDINLNGNMADEFSNLFKGYAWEPFLDDDGTPKLRTLPFDRFLVKSDSLVDPAKPDVFIKLIGQKVLSRGDQIREVSIRFAYTKDEFIAFTDDGELYLPAMQDNDGVNPFGMLPQMYGNRSPFKVLPTQDTDILPLTKIIPVILTDLSGHVLFSVFSITWGIDVSSENLTMSPNAFWSMKSDRESDKQPQVGTLKPQADIEKVLDYIKNTFSLWLETRGIKVGSMGSIDANNAASGIAKIIDEMDTSEMRKVAMEHFKKEEAKLWQLIKVMHNYWVDNKMLAEIKPRFSEGFKVQVTFDEPQPKISRKELVDTISLEVDKGFLDMRSAMERLYPDLTPEQIEAQLAAVKADKAFIVPALPLDPAETEPEDLDEDDEDDEE